MATLIGQELGGYRIISQVGKGGMATVYKAFQSSLDRYVAVKVMPPYYAQEDDTFIKRFRREAQSIAKLRHPNILLVIDYGEHEGLIYIVMEFVDAGTLTDRLGMPLPYPEAIKILDQVASALDYAHLKGLVHRDVKPSNILLPKPDWPLLTDFGLAKIVGGSQLTLTGTIAGTPAYMSPEQGQGENVDSRSDIYSLGIVLYEMMTGCVPYQAETPMAVVVKHIIEPLPLPRSKNPTIPEAVERVILKSLAKNPDDRYQRTTDLAQAFSDAVGTVVSMPSEPPTVLESTEVDVADVTPVEVPVKKEGDIESEIVTGPLPSVEFPEGITDVEPPPQILEPSPDIVAPISDVIERPPKRTLKDLLEGQPWLKWVLPAGAGVTAICIIGLVVAFLIIPNITDGNGTLTEIAPTLTAEEHFMDGKTFAEAGDLETAIIEYQTAIDQGIEDYNAYFSLADALVEEERMEEAVSVIDKVIRIAPEEAWVHEAAGWFFHEIEYHYEAIERFERARELDPNADHFLDGLAESYVAIGEYGKAEEIRGQSGKSDDEQDAYKLEEQGWEYLYAGDLDAAEDAFQEAVDLIPDLSGAWDGLSEVALYRGDLVAAIDILTTAVGISSEDPDLFEKLGWLYIDYGDFYGAEEAFNKVVFLDSSRISAWEGLSEAYWYLDELAEAIEAIDTAIKLNPNDDYLYEKLGWLYWEMGEYDPAISAFNEAIKIAPDSTYAYVDLAELWYELGEYGQALDVLESALDVNPDRPDIHRTMGFLLLELGQYEDAIASYNVALESYPEDGWSHLELAFAYRNLNMWDEALEALQNAEIYSFEDPWLLEAIGWEYFEMGECDHALDLFEQALDIDPTNEGALDGIALCSG